MHLQVDLCCDHVDFFMPEFSSRSAVGPRCWRGAHLDPISFASGPVSFCPFTFFEGNNALGRRAYSVWPGLFLSDLARYKFCSVQWKIACLKQTTIIMHAGRLKCTKTHRTKYSSKFQISITKKHRMTTMFCFIKIKRAKYKKNSPIFKIFM